MFDKIKSRFEMDEETKEAMKKELKSAAAKIVVGVVVTVVVSQASAVINERIEDWKEQRNTEGNE